MKRKHGRPKSEGKPSKDYPLLRQNLKMQVKEACSATCESDGRVTYHMRQPKKSGYSLIEVLIVVTIIGIISAAAVPSWLKRIENQRFKLTIENAKQLNLAVHDVMLREGVQEITFGQLPSNDKWLDVQSLISGGFEKLEVVGYTFHPEALNECYLSVVIFCDTDQPIYVKHLE